MKKQDFHDSGFWQRLCKIVKHSWFEYGVDAVLIINAIVLVIQSAEALSGRSNPQGDDGVSAKTHGLNSVLGWVYVLEMTLKIFVFGWK
ncbi:unnamed protein product, partial [Hapterophycus canaliculatus]